MTDGNGSNKNAAAPNERFSIVALAAVICLSVLRPVEMAWVPALMPLPVSCLLVLFGYRKGLQLTGIALLLAGLVTLAAGSGESLAALLFISAVMPVGVVVGRALLDKTPPMVAGLKALVVLACCWVLFWMFHGALTQTSPYQEMLTSIDQGLAQSSEAYEQAKDMPQASKEELKIVFAQMRKLTPIIFPGLLVATGVGMVWINMILAHVLLKKRKQPLSPWPEFAAWRLPEKLVWLMIAGGAATVINIPPLSTAGLNLLLGVGTIYFFQGLAVLGTIMGRWKMPSAIKAFLYIFVLVQMYSFFLLAALGVADIWVGFGSKEKDKP